MAWPWFSDTLEISTPRPSVTNRNSSAPEGEHRERAPERDAEDRDADGDARSPGPAAATAKYGAILPRNTSRGPKRHHRELLKRPGLPFPHHAEAGDDGADEHQDDSGQARDHDVGRLEPGVVKHRDLGARRRRAPRLRPRCCARRAVQRGERRLGGEQLAAVDEHHGPRVPVTTATAAWPSRSCVLAPTAAPSAGARCTTSNGAAQAGRPGGLGPATTAEIADTSKLAA